MISKQDPKHNEGDSILEDLSKTYTLLREDGKEARDRIGKSCKTMSETRKKGRKRRKREEQIRRQEMMMMMKMMKTPL